MLWLTVLVSGWAVAEDTETHPFSGVTCVHHSQTAPEALDYFLVRIDLRNPHIRFTTTPSNGPEPNDTRRQTTLEFVRQTGAQLGINANYFSMEQEKDTDVLGLAVSDGKVVSPWDTSGMACGVNIAKDNKVTFIERVKQKGTETNPPCALYNAVAGRQRLVKDGKLVAENGGERHPRTAVGHTAKNEFLMLVADGRLPGHSVGMTIHELAVTMQAAGAEDAIALDGGGSATLVIAAPEPRVVNVPMPTQAPSIIPATPPGIQRENGNNIAVFAAPVGAKP